MNAVLVDTNVLVYAYQTEGTDPRVRKAKEVLERLILKKRASASIQSIAEFGSVQMHKMKPTPAIEDIVQAVRDLAGALSVLPYSAAAIASALEASARHHLHFWDAMIWAVARENAIREVLSEDFQNGLVLDGVLFTNPFLDVET